MSERNSDRKRNENNNENQGITPSQEEDKKKVMINAMNSFRALNRRSADSPISIKSEYQHLRNMDRRSYKNWVQQLNSDRREASKKRRKKQIPGIHPFNNFANLKQPINQPRTTQQFLGRIGRQKTSSAANLDTKRLQNITVSEKLVSDSYDRGRASRGSSNIRGGAGGSSNIRGGAGGSSNIRGGAGGSSNIRGGAGGSSNIRGGAGGSNTTPYKSIPKKTNFITPSPVIRQSVPPKTNASKGIDKELALVMKEVNENKGNFKLDPMISPENKSINSLEINAFNNTSDEPVDTEELLIQISNEIRSKALVIDHSMIVMIKPNEKLKERFKEFYDETAKKPVYPFKKYAKENLGWGRKEQKKFIRVAVESSRVEKMSNYSGEVSRKLGLDIDIYRTFIFLRQDIDYLKRTKYPIEQIVTINDFKEWEKRKRLVYAVKQYILQTQDLNMADSMGRTALSEATWLGNTEAIKLLQEFGARK